MTPATQAYHDELVNKLRSGWEKNGFEDGLAGKVRVPVGARMSVTDRYMMGYRDAEQVLAMRKG